MAVVDEREELNFLDRLEEERRRQPDAEQWPDTEEALS